MAKWEPPPPGQWRVVPEPPPPAPPPPLAGPLPPPPPQIHDLNFWLNQPSQPFQHCPRYLERFLTVLVFASFAPSHPDPWLVDWSVRSVRQHLSTVKVIVLADGVAGAESAAYTEFKKRSHAIAFKGPHHISLMLREIIHYVRTPLVLMYEHDWALCRAYVGWLSIIRNLLDPSFPFEAIQLMQGEMGPTQCSALDGSVIERRGIALAPTRSLLVSGCVARTKWLKQLTEGLTEPEHLESNRCTERIRSGHDKIAWYVPRGPIWRGHHLDGAHVAAKPTDDCPMCREGYL